MTCLFQTIAAIFTRAWCGKSWTEPYNIHTLWS